MEPRVIKSPEDHKETLAEIERLIDRDPEPGSAQAERLEVLSKLVEDYEGERFSFEVPDPLDAIRFRMEEQGLRQRDLVPFIGSRSRVSEVLSGKRPLTADMLRALHGGLGIPSHALLQRPDAPPTSSSTPDWSRYPTREMVNRGWLTPTKRAPDSSMDELLQTFFSEAEQVGDPVALYRRTISERAGRSMDPGAVRAWTARILIRAQKAGFSRPYVTGSLTQEKLRELARISASDRGPILAREFLSELGVTLVVEAHLPRTRLDGAAMLTRKGNPVIGLTLRHDRVDNFWFTLMHELVHTAKHLKESSVEVIVDDLDVKPIDDDREREADIIAEDLLIPRSVWKRSDAYVHKTVEAVNALAKELKIHPAIVAGRLRRDTDNYQILAGLVGNGKVRELFSEVTWS